MERLTFTFLESFSAKLADVLLSLHKKVSNFSLTHHSREAVRRYLSATNGHPAMQLHRVIMAEVEKPLLEEALKHCTNNLTHTAEMLGLSRATLRKKLDDYGIAH